MENYWRSIILFGRNVASYKFALAKALYDLKDSSNDIIKLEELAKPYVKHLLEHLKHSPKQITSKSSTFLQTCEQYNKNEITYDELISKAVKLGFANVIDAFHNVNSKEIDKRFFIDERRVYNASLHHKYFPSLELSTPIKYLGFPNYKFPDKYSLTEANITSIKISSLREYIEVDKTIKSGNSGGPAILNNKVIGLCTNGDHTMGSMPNRILSVKHIIKILDSI